MLQIKDGLLVACAIGANVVSGVNKGCGKWRSDIFSKQVKVLIWSSYWHVDHADPLADRYQSVHISPH